MDAERDSQSSQTLATHGHSLTAPEDTHDPIKNVRKPARVLIADDQASVRGWLESLLTGWGYEVVAAKDGAEALQILQQADSPSIAIVDWIMPKMDGTEVCRRIRQSLHSHYIYIILLTSKTCQSDTIEGLGSGADDYLRKPFDPRELQARLEVASRIAVEKTLRDNEQRFHAAAELAAAGMAIADTEARFLEVNEGFCQLLGYQREELLKKTVFDICHPEDLEGARKRFAQFAGSDVSAGFERRYLHRSGATIWALVTISFVHHGDGTSDFVVAQIQDITKRKVAEEMLRRSEALFRAITENTDELIRVLERDGTILYASPSHEALLGYPVEELRGVDSVKTLIHSSDRPAVVEWLQQLLDSGRAAPAQFRFRHKDGSTRMLDSCGGVIRNTEGRVDKVVVTSRDMTERKLLESRLHQARKLEATGQLAAGVAHEINTPIQYVRDNALFVRDSWKAASALFGISREIRDEAQKGAVSAETLAHFDRVWEQADCSFLEEEVPPALDQELQGLQRIAQIVQAMKDFSSSHSEHKEALNLNRALETIVTVSRNEWIYVSDLYTSFDESLPRVACLVSEFNQAILGILMNAAQAISQKIGDNPGSKGTIKILTQRTGDFAEIRITDSGTGIPEAIRDKIYDPFFTTREVGTGIGHGLTLAHSAIVQKHGGELWFETEVGKGTTFFIRLPINGNA